MATFPLLKLPEDIIGVIFSFLSVQDLASFALSSKRFYRVSSSNLIWRHKLTQSFMTRSPNRVEEDNFADLKRHVLFARWSAYSRWCNPEALQIGEGEFKRVHEFFAATAIKDVSITHLTFRGKKYRIERHETSGYTIGWWYDKPRSEITVKTDDFKFAYHHPVPRPADANPPAHVSVDNDLGADKQVAKTIVRRRERAARNTADTRCPAAAIIDGVVLRVTPPPLPLEPAPEASAEPGHAKFVYRHAYIKFHDLCPLCVRNRSSDCNGDIPPFCRSCWLSHDLNLYMSAEQAAEEYSMDEGDLYYAHKRYKDNKRTPGRTYHFRGSTRAHIASLATLTAAAAGNSEEQSRAVAFEVPSANTPFYREYDVAYLAIMKWGSSSAVARRYRERREASSRAHRSTAKLVDDVSVLDAEMLETEQRRAGVKRKRSKSCNEDEDTAFKPYKSSRSLGSAQGASRKSKTTKTNGREMQRRSARKAAKGKFYGEERNELDTRVDESTLGDLVRWGTLLVS